MEDKKWKNKEGEEFEDKGVILHLLKDTSEEGILGFVQTPAQKAKPKEG